MSTSQPTERSETDGGSTTAPVAATTARTDRFDIASRIEFLGSENPYKEYVRARKTYRRAALVLATVGLAMLAGGVLLPAERTVFVALGAIGVYGAVLTYYVTPERFVAANVAERIYGTTADNWSMLASALDLQSIRIYRPGKGTQSPRLCVPRHERGRTLNTVQSTNAPSLEERQDLVLEPIGAALVREIEHTLSGELAQKPAPLAVQLCDGITDQFELASRANPQFDPESDCVTVAISDSAVGPLDRFDHPIPSILATGLATGLERPVKVDVTSADGRADWFVTCQFYTSSADRDRIGGTNEG